VSDEPELHPARFATTHWSVVVAAGAPIADTESHAALEALCRAYWFPLYAYVRRRGHAPHDAQDLTQEFFARLLAGNWVADADQSKGRFRTFLLTALDRFLANAWDRAQAQKRGGGQQIVSLQLDDAEERLRCDPVDSAAAPERAFERRWALTLLETVVQKLAEEHRADGKAALFAALKPCLVGDRTAQPYAELAVALGLTEGAIKVSVHRLRQRYREMLRDEIAQTVANPGDVDAEMRHLFRVLSS
jgi:RNA polymerase sigma-70 factor (ECF subfamily)